MRSANTHFPEIIGAARGFELTGNATQKAIATNFFHILTAGEGQQWDPAAPGGHSFATGGSNAAEHWFNASFLGDSLMPVRWGNYRNIGARTEESCTQYNSLKVARQLIVSRAVYPVYAPEGGDAVKLARDAGFAPADMPVVLLEESGSMKLIA